jgi:hypothetical protein
VKIEEMSRKELLAQPNEFGYTGPVSYSKEKLRFLLREQSCHLVEDGNYGNLTGTRSGAEIYGRTGSTGKPAPMTQADVVICRTPRADHYFTVHSADCKQCPKTGDNWAVTTKSRLGVVADVYGDHVGDRGAGLVDRRAGLLGSPRGRVHGGCQVPHLPQGPAGEGGGVMSYTDDNALRILGYVEEDIAKREAELASLRKIRTLARRHAALVEAVEIQDRMNECAACTWWREGDRDTHTCGTTAGERITARKVREDTAWDRKDRAARKIKEAWDKHREEFGS